MAKPSNEVYSIVVKGIFYQFINHNLNFMLSMLFYENIPPFQFGVVTKAGAK
jgi:hypothetical protein